MTNNYSLFANKHLTNNQPPLLECVVSQVHIYRYFQGELEQLTVADESSGGVSEQCSPNRMPFQREDDNNSDIHIQEDNTKDKKKGTVT